MHHPASAGPRASDRSPFSTFHRRTFEHKFTEALHLLVSLGATALTVYCEEGWGREFAGALHIPNLVHVDFHRRHTKRSTALFEGTFQPHAPRLPDDLAWFHHEPAWQEIARERLDGHAKKLALTLEYTDDYGIGTSFAERVSDVGLEVGGRFAEHVRTVWRMQVTFRRSWGERLHLPTPSETPAAEAADAETADEDV